MTIGTVITAQVIGLITGTNGVNSAIQMLDTPLSAAQVRAQNVASDMADRGNTMQYPAVNVYCEKLVNNLAEKFRTFSGMAQMVVELRHSQDRLEGLQERLETYTDAILQVLNTNRGDWGSGFFYSGEYQAAFAAVKHGGKNFIQAAKITFEIGVSKN